MLETKIRNAGPPNEKIKALSWGLTKALTI